MSHHGRHRRRSFATPIAAAAVTMAILAAAAWMAGGAFDGNGPQRADRSPTSQARTTTTQAALARATDDCRTASDLFTRDLVAMGGAIQQWRLHIDAMTELVAGKIDLDQAMAFWDSTRVEGKRSLALWEREDRRYRAERKGCAVPDSAGSADDLTVCQQRQHAADAVLRQARATLADWKQHIKDMDALRAGTLDATMAVHMWHRMYQRGKKQLRGYDAAHLRLERQPPCAI